MYTVHCTHFVLLSHCCCCRHRARVLSYKWNTIINARQRIPNVVIPYIFVIWRFFHGIHWIQRELWFCAHSLNVRISFVRIVILSSFQFLGSWCCQNKTTQQPKSTDISTVERQEHCHQLRIERMQMCWGFLKNAETTFTDRCKIKAQTYGENIFSAAFQQRNGKMCNALIRRLYIATHDMHESSAHDKTRR